MSTYVNTGRQRATTLSINKTVNGSSIPNYPKEYSILAAFTHSGQSYGVLTQTAFLQLPNAEYDTRLAAFKGYVASAEDVASIDAIATNSPTPTNTTACPVGAS